GHGTGPKWQPGAGGMGLHTIILDASNPQRIFIAISAAGAFRTDDGGKTWKAINRGLKSQYLPEPMPEVGFCVHHMVMHRSRPGGDEWEPLTKGLPQENCFVNVLREGLAVDSLDKCGVYVGTTGGQVYASSDAGDSWMPIVHDLPAVLSVEIQTLP